MNGIIDRLVDRLAEYAQGRQVKQLLSAARHRLGQFKRLQSLDLETKHRIESSVRHYVIQLTAARRNFYRVVQAGAATCGVISIFLILGAPLWVGWCELVESALNSTTIARSSQLGEQKT